MNYTNFIQALTKQTTFSGDIENNIAQKIVQATDNSIYHILPDLILYPKTTQDIKHILKIANLPQFQNINLTSRGGCTATNGQSLNSGIIIDCAKHLNKIIKFNKQEQWIDVEPGITLRELNNFLAPYDYHFAINISPDDRATIGGMIATDASGKASHIYGKTSDNLISVNTLLANNQQYIFKNHSKKNLNDKIIKQINNIISSNITAIQKSFPTHKRFASGYNLAKLTDQKNFNLNYLIAGSEGTLAIITKARLKIHPKPQYRSLIITHYNSFNNCLKDAKNLLPFKPIAIETIDTTLLNLSKNLPLYHQIKQYLCFPNSHAINILEFSANTKAQLKILTANFNKTYKQHSLCNNANIVAQESDIKKIWELRSLAVGIAGNMPGNQKPIAFIEDTAIPPQNLVNYVNDLRKMLASYQLKYVIYGHLDVGCLHVRPALDLHDPQQQKLIPEITAKTIKLVKKYQGIIWGEHGIGFRVSYSKEFFGTEIFELFCQIKHIFDPHNRLNPGKISLPKQKGTYKLKDILNNLHADHTKKITNHLAKKFNNILTCNGNTKCLSINNNQVMCPSWKVTKEKIHSPKGRSNLIEDWLIFRSSYKIPHNPIKKFIFSRKHHHYLTLIYNSLNNCLGCHACNASCPIKVNIPFHKSLFLAWYHKLYFRPVKDYLLANIESLIAFCARFAPIFNFLLQNKLSKFITLKIFHLNKIPKLQKNYYLDHMQKLIYHNTDDLPKNSIFLIADTFNSFINPQTLEDSVKLLQQLNFNVKIIPFFSSGKSALNLGFLKKSSHIINKNINDLNHISSLNYPIITIEPIINFLLMEEYQKFSDRKITYTVQLISEFLNNNLKLLKDYQTNTSIPNKDIYLFSHCTEKTCMPQNITFWQNIFSTININLTSLDSGCCGMAGSYGYEAEHNHHSQQLFDLTWNTHLQTQNSSQICATGFSCREQIKHLQNKNIPHPISILNLLLQEEGRDEGRIFR